MIPILLFDIRSFGKPVCYIVLLLLTGAGIFAGYQFNLTVGEGVFLNSAYTAGFMLGFLSLSLVFIATILAGQLLFRERDARFDLMIFSLPVKENSFISGRFLSFFTLTFLCFLCMVIGFVIGQNLRTGAGINPDFYFSYYLYPLIVLGVINCLIVCSILFFLGIFTRNKMAVIIGGLLLYVLYMVMLIYSGSPFMVGALPQSNAAQKISALTDPFGLSAYFFQARDFTVAERNSSLVPLSGVFLANRLIVLFFSLLFLALSVRSFSFRLRNKRPGKGKKIRVSPYTDFNSLTASPITVCQNHRKINRIKSILSFVKMDLVYAFKSIVFYAICLLLLFYVGMEIYAAIDQGIRFPQHYASSGLMAQTINKNFYLPGVFLSVYLINELYWRSRTSNFSPVENATYFFFVKTVSHWLSISALLLVFSLLLILEGLIFQWIFNYPRLDGMAYGGVLVFNTLPLILLSGFLVLLNALLKKKYTALAVSVVFAAIFATPLSKTFIEFSLLRFLSGYHGAYSDFLGYGIYMGSFIYRLLFGLGMLIIFWLVFDYLKRKQFNLGKIILGLITLALVFISGNSFQKGYLAKGENIQFLKSATYEKKYRKYQDFPQPTIIAVKTRIDLYPSENAYTLHGTYSLKNLTGRPVENILFNFEEALQLEKAVFTFRNKPTELKKKVEVLKLSTPLAPGDEAALGFSLRYQWHPVNGHNPANVIVENGSFMRISRYYPAIGYQAGNEITDDKKDKRAEFGLGKATGIKKLEAPKTNPRDFIDLDMTISTTSGQTAIGTGELIRQWKKGDRHYFQYSAENIPFRFAVSSANYAVKKTIHKGHEVNVFYLPSHFENVNRLIENAKQSLDYCIENFGSYPFRSVSFAEVSSFTAGFSATAYPSAIFMTENMAFHTNVDADKGQDVINELAAHELSHFWWGNNRISPDDREGATMLTETLAMYTEMMICKEKYGEKEMNKRLRIHEQIYRSEKGFYEEQPLFKVTPENTHISYSKGAIVMVKLSREIGEQRLNKILKTFLEEHKYPQRATALDFLEELKQELSTDEYRRMEGLFTQ
ncbi:M1 family aminopeptidase [Sinomicrobium weinanense]|uniref:Aminopeptidase n=1 Tax=Sinomicrobium weinanense TaxID=2842200 RepID=A0A926Q2V5_9FLAO|nr:M1 family aminopeptidase [Sinomicrobium weinanense]MBC9795085.1 aminopeptidase [Sinomicrobium weinanense]MBU3123784.1 aminopeptidase [Sinomicrobium weinanense]